MAEGQLGGAAQKALGLQPQFSTAAILNADPEYTEARGKLKGLDAQRDKAGADYKAAADPLKKKVESERTALEGMQAPQLQEIPDKFVPPKQDPKEQQEALSTMFMFAAIGGLMTRQPMTAALNSFAGAMEGLHAGNMEKYKKEHEVFQTNVKVAQAKNQEYIQKFDMAVKKRRGDIQGLMEDIKLLNTEYGNTVQAVNAERQDLRALMTGRESAAKADAHMAANMKKMDQQHGQVMARMAQQEARDKERIREFDIREKRMAESQAAKEKLAREKATLAAESKGGLGKPSPTIVQAHQGAKELLRDIDEIEKMMASPGMREKIDSQQLTRIFSETAESKFIQQLLVRPNLDPEVKKFVTTVTQMRNKYYLEQSGKAVTGGEALRNYGAVVAPEDSTADIATKLSVAKPNIQQKQRDFEEYYPALAGPARGAGQPSGGAPAGGGTFASEADADAAAKAGKIKKGDRITINGQTGTWQ
jgi:hypothetical protein